MESQLFQDALAEELAAGNISEPIHDYLDSLDRYEDSAILTDFLHVSEGFELPEGHDLVTSASEARAATIAALEELDGTNPEVITRLRKALDADYLEQDSRAYDNMPRPPSVQVKADETVGEVDKTDVGTPKPDVTEKSEIDKPVADLVDRGTLAFSGGPAGGPS